MYIVVIFFLLVRWPFDCVAETVELRSDDTTPATQSYSPPLMVKLGQLSNHQLILNLLPQRTVFMLLHNLQQNFIGILVPKHLDNIVCSEWFFQLLQGLLINPIIADTFEYNCTRVLLEWKLGKFVDYPLSNSYTALFSKQLVTKL